MSCHAIPVRLVLMLCATGGVSCGRSHPSEKDGDGSGPDGKEVPYDDSVTTLSIPDGSELSPPDVHELDGDFFDDLVVGARLNGQTGSASGVDSYGAIFVFSGPLSSGHLLSGEDADYVIREEEFVSVASEHFGAQVVVFDAMPGEAQHLVVSSVDVDAMGEVHSVLRFLNAEVLLSGMPYADAIDASIAATEPGSIWNWSDSRRTVDSGDVDGDGTNDVLFHTGALGERSDFDDRWGGVCVFYGPLMGSKEFADADYVLWDDYYGERWASSAVRVGGDVNGDGYADILGSGAVGGAARSTGFVAYGGPNKGSEQFEPEIVLVGGVVGDPATSQWDQDYFGYSADYIGDRDGDGADDIAIGAIGAGTYQGSEGAAYVFEGLTPGTYGPDDAVLAVQGFAGAKVGSSLVGMGDLLGDGSTALLVGSFGMDGDRPSERVGAWLYGDSTGAVGVNDAVATFSPGDEDESAALQMASGDMDGDGLQEAVILNDDNTLFIVPGALFVE